MAEKRVVFSKHALDRMAERGVTVEETVLAIRSGERAHARGERITFRKNLPFSTEWKNRYYETKQVMPIVEEKADRFVVVTVYSFYFGGKE